MSKINLPATLEKTPTGNALAQLLSQPGTKATVEVKEDKQTITAKRKEKDYSVQLKIDHYTDGTQRTSQSISPAIPAKDKKQTFRAMKDEGKTQQQIADETGVSQATVSRILNG